MIVATRRARAVQIDHRPALLHSILELRLSIDGKFNVCYEKIKGWRNLQDIRLKRKIGAVMSLITVW